MRIALDTLRKFLRWLGEMLEPRNRRVKRQTTADTQRDSTGGSIRSWTEYPSDESVTPPKHRYCLCESCQFEMRGRQ